MSEATPIKPSKFAAYRARKKAAGLREVRMWLPDMRDAAIRADLARQAALLDRSADEREAAAMMRALGDEAWGDHA